MSNGLSKADMATRALAKRLEQIKITKDRSPKEINEALINSGLEQLRQSNLSPGDDDSSPELDRKALEKDVENKLKRWNKIKVK